MFEQVDKFRARPNEDDSLVRMGGTDGFDDEATRDARDRLLAGRVDLGDNRQVGTVESVRELRRQRLGARIAVRLKDGHDPTPLSRLACSGCGGDIRRYLGREVGVVVDEGHPARRSATFESTANAFERGDRLGRGRRSDTKFDGDREGRYGVSRHMQPGHGNCQLRRRIHTVLHRNV